MTLENYLTLQEASKKGYGTVASILAQIRRKSLKAEKVGVQWLVNIKELDAMKERKKIWAKQWTKKKA